MSGTNIKRGDQLSVLCFFVFLILFWDRIFQKLLNFVYNLCKNTKPSLSLSTLSLLSQISKLLLHTNAASVLSNISLISSLCLMALTNATIDIVHESYKSLT